MPLSNKIGYPAQMETKEIETLFERLSQAYGISPGGSKEIFTFLVTITLKYRDMLLVKGEKALTIDEVRNALDELLHVMESKKFSSDLSSRIQTLVTLWYDEVKLRLYN